MAAGEPDLTPELFFAGSPLGLRLFREVERAVSELGAASVRVTRSQIAFGRRRGFAYVWRPGQYMRSEVPAVLSIALRRAVRSPRIKEVAHPSAKVWMHHIELADPVEVDDELRAWLAEAYAAAE